MIPLLTGAAVFCGCWSLWCLYWYRRSTAAARERIRTGLGLPKPEGDLLSRIRRAVGQVALAQELERMLARANLAIPVADLVLLLLAGTVVLALLLSRAFAIAFLPSLALALSMVVGGARVFLKQRGASLAQGVSGQMAEAARILYLIHRTARIRV